MGGLKDTPGRGPVRASAMLRALRKLVDATVSIIETRDGDVAEFLYMRRGAGASLSAGKLASGTALEMRSRGLIEARGGAWVLSLAGRAFLKRNEHGALGFIAQHAELEQVAIGAGQARERVTRNAAESPLAWLRRRKGRAGLPLVDDDQYEAGERLRRDFTKAQMMPKLGATWSPLATRDKHRSGSAGGQADMADHVLDARHRVDKALDAVGSEFASLLIDVCCLLRGLERVEEDYGWPRRAGKLVLQLALNALARHYGLIADNRRSAPGAMRHWAKADYRPQIE